MDNVIDIAALRKYKKIKQSEMADILGVNQSQISEIERGIRPVSSKYEEILVEQFGKDVCDRFRVASEDNRRLSIKGNVNISGNGSIQDTNKKITSGNSEHDELIRLRVEVQYLREQIVSLQKTNEDLRKMNNYLMSKK